MQKPGKILLAATLALVLLGGAALALVVNVLTVTPDFTKLRDEMPIPVTLRDKSKSTRMVGPRAPHWVRMSDISDHLLMAVISSEDTSFFSNQGVDFHELQEAIKKDLKEKKWARGASTLTQQVVKNVYLSQEKTISRKIQELIWAREMDKVLSKSEILCFYVNMAEWGLGIYGIQEAANYYFQIPPSQLSPKQSAFLAMLLPSPKKYEMYFQKKELTPWATSRVEQILHVMNKMNFLDDEEYTAAMNEALWVKGNVAPEVANSTEGESTVQPSESKDPGGLAPPLDIESPGNGEKPSKPKPTDNPEDLAIPPPTPAPQEALPPSS